MNQFGQLVSAHGFGLPASLNFRMIKLFHLPSYPIRCKRNRFAGSKFWVWNFLENKRSPCLLVCWCALPLFFPTLPLTPYVAKKSANLTRIIAWILRRASAFVTLVWAPSLFHSN